MKSVFRVLLVLVLGACFTEDDVTPPDGIIDGTMSGTIATDPWSATHSLTARFSAGVLTIVGESRGRRQVSLVINNIAPDDAHANVARTVHFTADNWETVGFARLLGDTYGRQNVLYSTVVGGHGTVTFTHLSSTQAVGSFTFVGALPAGSTMQPINVIVAGQFDVTIS